MRNVYFYKLLISNELYADTCLCLHAIWKPDNTRIRCFSHIKSINLRATLSASAMIRSYIITINHSYLNRYNYPFSHINNSILHDSCQAIIYAISTSPSHTPPQEAGCRMQVAGGHLTSSFNRYYAEMTEKSNLIEHRASKSRGPGSAIWQ